MTIFKTFLKVLNDYKPVVITYTVILIVFSAFSMQTSNNSTGFEETKPDILIINNDVEEGITKNLINYIEKNSNIIDIKNEEEAIDDALFYRDVNYIIYIPENYRSDFLLGKNPKIEIKSTQDYQSSLAQMMLERYIKVANTYNTMEKSEEKIIENINDTLLNETQVEVTSKLDASKLSKASFYYNFANYSILAGCVYIICLILSSFRDEKIRKRTIISSMNYREYNRKLILSNGLFAIILWMFYVLISFILIGNVMFSINGLLIIFNSLIFTICAISIAFLIGNIISNKNAINGIVNVIGLGSSFLCGAFVPMEFLPDSVLKIAHIFPSYYYILNNETIKNIENFNIETLKPVFENIFAILLFTIGFILITNIISMKKRKIN